jgi:hypothetical protein
MNARSSCRRGAEVARWLVPSATLALVPKCPACLAAYIALTTGLGISFSMAACIRTSLIIGSVAVLIFVAARRGIRWSSGRGKRRPSSDQAGVCARCCAATRRA